jgi:hypothetical protein
MFAQGGTPRDQHAEFAGFTLSDRYIGESG